MSCWETLHIDEHWFGCFLPDDGHAIHEHTGEANDYGGTTDPTMKYRVTWERTVDVVDAAPNPDRPQLGLLQVLPDSHPLVKYGSWENVPEDERWEAGR